MIFESFLNCFEYAFKHVMKVNIFVVTRVCFLSSKAHHASGGCIERLACIREKVSHA